MRWFLVQETIGVRPQFSHTAQCQLVIALYSLGSNVRKGHIMVEAGQERTIGKVVYLVQLG
jgi:hypothetical protein